MKLFLALGVVVGAYLYAVLHVTDTVLSQTLQLQAQYQYVADHADQLVAGR